MMLLLSVESQAKSSCPLNLGLSENCWKDFLLSEIVKNNAIFWAEKPPFLENSGKIHILSTDGLFHQNFAVVCWNFV